MKSLFFNTLTRFKNDESASLTLEFVLILPLLVTWFIGSIIFFDAYNSKATSQRTAHTLADIMSRQTNVDNAFIDSLLTIQNRMIPRSGVGTVQVTSIQRDMTGNLQLLWTHTTDATASALLLADIPLASIPVLANGESVLLVDTSVPFVPIADWVGFTATNWTYRIPIAPRYVEPLPNSDFP